jgi:predicted nucleotidyltransferase
MAMDLDYKTIFKQLNESGVDYLVVGGLAVNFHGIPRMTYDIDLMILLEPKNVLTTVDKISGWGYKPKIPVNPQDLADDNKRNLWIREKGMKALNFYSETLPIGGIDIVIDSPFPYDELKSRAIVIEIQEINVPTVSIHDLIALKKKAGRRQDLSDIEYLKIILEK